MNLQNTALATLAGAVTLFALGFVIYAALGGGEMIFNGPDAAGAMKADFSLGAIFLIEICTALLMTIIYQQWANISTFMTGAKNGLWIGALLALIVTLDYYSGTNLVTVAGVLFYAITHAIRTAVAGGVIGLVLGRMAKS